jgi:hypothetical protein
MPDSKGIMTETMLVELERLKLRPSLTQIQGWRLNDLQYRLDTYNPKNISPGAISSLIGTYLYLKYGRRPQRKGHAPIQLIKGSTSEVAASKMVERVTGQAFYKNKKRLSNDYLKGILDVTSAPTIEDSKYIIEIKNSKSLHTFAQSAREPLPPSIDFQVQGYFALTGLEKGIVYNCLVDMPDHLIKEQYDLLFQTLCPDGIITDLFTEEWSELEHGFRFNDIPEEERVIPFPVERNEKTISNIYEKLELCREWLAEFHELYKKKTYAIVLDS